MDGGAGNEVWHIIIYPISNVVTQLFYKFAISINPLQCITNPIGVISKYAPHVWLFTQQDAVFSLYLALKEGADI